MSEWESWIGRSQSVSDILDAARAARWCATFDRAVPHDGIMPQGIHFCLCTPDAATAALGEDGHPARDDSQASFLPPIPLPRRMWAGSDIAFHAPIRVGARIERTSRIESIRQKDGASGRLVFVDVRHVTTADDVEAVSETQTLVYRAAAGEDDPLQPALLSDDRFDPGPWQRHREIVPDPRLLFRYSALTFNTHRIHYDAPYARDVERYRGLVVHGPLTASLLLLLAADAVGDNRLARFAFRGLSPALADEALHLVLRDNEQALECAAFAGDGRHVTKAEAWLTC